MRWMKLSFNLVLLSAITGCTSMNTPDMDLINKVPTIKMGSQKPEGHDYILYIPARAEIPVHLTVAGSLISAPIDHKSVTKINQDLYIYKYWASLDGKNWVPSRDLVSMPVAIGVGPEGGQVRIKVDFKKKP